MIRFGPNPARSREMDLNDIFILRLKLLVVMARSFLNGDPLGAHRRQTILENARHIESEAIDIGRLST